MLGIATHALLSLLLYRSFFSRRPWPVALAMLLAGTLADVDLLGAPLGPKIYFLEQRALAHSVLGTIVVLLLSALVVFYFVAKQSVGLNVLLGAAAIAAMAHVLADCAESRGVALLSPFRGARYAADWLPETDAACIALLLAGILLPELIRLVSSEIGSKEKAPRGRNGAIVALLLILLYVGARATLHAGSLATLDAHSYHGESPRALQSFPDSLSLFAWHGAVETSSSLCLLDVPSSSAVRFDPESANCQHKPEQSPMLAASETTRSARTFLASVRFPKASVDKTVDGYEVALRDVRDLVLKDTTYSVAARILLDPSAKVTSQELVWADEVHLR
jgi:membrane-bound metal-dependent hydrolase YbcI (DUF457 family)